jgi:hypothetical protein
VIGYVDEARSEKFPEDMLATLILDREGRVLGGDVLSFGRDTNCEMAASREGIAIARVNKNDRVAVSLLSPDGLRDAGGFVLPDRTFVGPWDLGIVAHREGWAILHRGADGAMRVSLVESSGALRRIVELPARIDPGSVDLSGNDSGLFVTWLARDQVHVLSLDSGAVRSWNARRKARGTTAIGHDDRCAIAWTNRGGTKLHVLSADRCP